jgi:hypothetical protein
MYQTLSTRAKPVDGHSARISNRKRAAGGMAGGCPTAFGWFAELRRYRR